MQGKRLISEGVPTLPAAFLSRLGVERISHGYGEDDLGFAMNDKTYMRRALELAERGRGLTSPGAMVGAVIVQDGDIVGEGFYTWNGVDHAEIQALDLAGERAHGATIYLSLEPCAHRGKTPPCAEALVNAGIARVVVAMEDPYPEVDGRGIEVLRRAGIAVECGLCRTEALAINEAFVHSVGSDRPFGLLKIAMSLDGKIATENGESQWITSEESRRRVQLLRHGADALLTGSGTVLADDPRLTDRSGIKRRRPLIRAVIDRRGRLGGHLQIFSSPGILVYTQVSHLEVPPSHEVVLGTTGLRDVARDLARRDVQTLMVECGPDMAFDALRSGIIDKMVVFVAPRILGGREIPAIGSKGVDALADAVEIKNWHVERVGPDFMITGYVHRDH